MTIKRKIYIKADQCRVCQQGDLRTCLACATGIWVLGERASKEDKERYKRFLKAKYAGWVNL